MALRTALVTFALNTAPGVQTVSGVGFAGTALLLWTTRQTAVGQTAKTIIGIGLTDGVAQACRSIHLSAIVGESGQLQQTTGRILKLASAATTVGGSVAEVEVSFTAWTSDGFTLDAVTTDGVAILCHALVLGGDEVEADGLNSPVMSATNVTVTTGFQPDAFIALGGTEGTNYVLGWPYGSMHGLGLSDGVTNLCTWSLGPDLRRGQWTDRLYSIRTANNPGASQLAAGHISAVSATGFTVTRTDWNVVAQPFILSLKGVRVALGAFTQPATGDHVLAVPFPAKALILQTHGNVAGDNQQHYGLGLGAWAEGNDAQGFAWGSASSGTLNHIRAWSTARVLELWSPNAAGTPATLVTHATVSAVDDAGVTLTWTSDGAARQILYLALGSAPGGCSGGVVPSVADPEDGVTFEGLGPHADRVFLELELDEGLETWALHDPMNDAPDLAAHAGRKAGRLLSVGAITRRTTDRLGGWQTSGARFQADDHDRVVRGLIAAGTWYNREFRAYVADRLAVADARCLGRFITREYPPTAELTVDVEGVDIIGSEFSPFALDRDVLASCLFDRARVPSAPATLIDAKRPIPVYMGRWSDEGSETSAPVFHGAAWRGAVTSPPYWEMGFHAMPAGGPPPPDTVTAAAEAGGSINLGDSPTDRVFYQVWAVTDGVEGDPLPFYADAVAPVAIPANGSAVRVSWTSAGADPDVWRVGLAHDYYRAKWHQVLEVPGAARDALFLTHPVPTPGATAAYMNRGEYRVLANMPDGRTAAALPFAIMTTGPYRRPGHISWIPVAGAISYEVYKAPVPSAFFGITEWFTVPVQVDSDGLHYFVDTWDAGTATTSIPAPQGLLPVIDCGDVTLASGTWGLLVLARWAWHRILGVYAGGARLTTSDPDVLHPDHDAWPFPARTVLLGDCACTVVYARGARLAAHRDGSAVIRVNACTTEDVGDGTGSTITQAARGVQHLLTELVMNDARGGVEWAGIPVFDDGTAMIRSSSYAAAELVQIARVGGEGYVMRLALDTTTPLRALIQGFVQSFGLHHGINRHGQVVCGHYDDAVEAGRTYRLVTDAREIVGDVTIHPRTHELETTIPYQAAYQPADQSFAITDVEVEDAAAVAANRGKPRRGPDRTLAYTADPATIADVMARALSLGRSVRSWVEVPVSIVGLDVDVFDVVYIDDEAGPFGPAGAFEAAVLVLEHEVRPPEPASDRPLTVMLKGLDVTALLDTAWAWGPDTITTWDTMTADERGTWGAWAADDDTIPSDDASAREWR